MSNSQADRLAEQALNDLRDITRVCDKAHALAAMESGDWLPDADGMPRYSASKLRAPQCEQAAAYAEARDNILNGRGPLEAVLDGDQTNAVLAVLDDAFAQGTTPALAENGIKEKKCLD